MRFWLFLVAALQLVARAGTLTVEVLDVGQGDSILIRTPAGKTVLIDAGTGKRDVVPMLAARSVSQLDLVIGTHNHADHIGGMDEVLESIPTRLYFDQGLPHETGTYAEVMRLVEAKGIAYKPGRRGQSFNLDDGIRVELLGPEDPLLRNTRSDLNSNSIITRLTHGKNCFLFVGDAEAETEHRLLKAGLTSCSVLKVAHHGSAYASSHGFLKVVQPQIAVISAGEDNRYGHPTPATLQRLEAVGAQIFRTDQQGTVRMLSDGKTVAVVVERPGPKPLPPGASVAPAPFDTAQPAGIAALDVKHRPPAAAVAAAPLAAALAERAPTAPAVEAGRAAIGAVTAGPRWINSATAEQLMSVPGIGPKKAAAIVAWREKNGAFSDIDAVAAVPGIGPATVAAIKAHAAATP